MMCYFSFCVCVCVQSISEVVVEVSTCSSERKKQKVDTSALQKMQQ